jgi:hypothetical protein
MLQEFCSFDHDLRKETAIPTRESADEKIKWMSRCGTGTLKIKTRFPDAGQRF